MIQGVIKEVYETMVSNKLPNLVSNCILGKKLKLLKHLLKIKAPETSAFSQLISDESSRISEESRRDGEVVAMILMACPSLIFDKSFIIRVFEMQSGAVNEMSKFICDMEPSFSKPIEKNF